MSKMSQLHAELSEQAYELGFESIEEAEANGYVCDLTGGKLIDGREQAHNEWLKDKEEVLERLRLLQKAQHLYEDDKDDIEMAIKFIEGGEV